MINNKQVNNFINKSTISLFLLLIDMYLMKLSHMLLYFLYFAALVFTIQQKITRFMKQNNKINAAQEIALYNIPSVFLNTVKLLRSLKKRSNDFSKEKVHHE